MNVGTVLLAELAEELCVQDRLDAEELSRDLQRGVERALDALRRAAGGADRVVLAWDGDTVTLHTLEQRTSEARPDPVGSGWLYGSPLFRLVPVTPSEASCPVGGMHMAKATEDACPACAVSPEPPKEPHDA